MCIASVPPGSRDTGERSVQFSSILSAAALHCDVEGTVASYFDILVLVHITMIKAAIALKSQREKYNRGCLSFHVFRTEKRNRPLQCQQ
jgi:hypothetical protein